MIVKHNCLFKYCTDDCYKCSLYKPKAFGINIPKKLAKIIYNVELFIMKYV